MSDLNHVEHYCRGEIECIDAIEASMPPEQFMGALKFNVLKYVWRYDTRWEDDIDAQIKDLVKAQDYLGCMITRLQAKLSGR